MTTPRIEEKYEEYRKKFLLATGPETEDGLQIYCSRCSGSEEFYTFFTQALTEAHQAGIDEAVKVMEEKRVTYGTLRNYSGGVEDNHTHDIYNQALDDTVKALQDNK